MNKAYAIRVTEPMQIPAVVYETRRRVTKNREPLSVLLSHQEEPNVVRGSNQPLEKPEITEIKRPDPGLSWYHPSTFCFTRGYPVSMDGTSQREWSHYLVDLLSSKGYDRSNLVFDNRDIYINNGSVRQQLIGLSGWRSQGVKIQRACWYEEDPIPEIGSLLEADGINPKKFREAMQTVDSGFFRYLVNRLQAREIDAQDFVSAESISEASDLQKRKSGSHRGSCVLGESK